MLFCELQSQTRAIKRRPRQQNLLGTIIFVIGAILPLSSSFQITSTTSKIPSKSYLLPQTKTSSSDYYCQSLRLSLIKPTSLFLASSQYSNDIDEDSDAYEYDIEEEYEEEEEYEDEDPSTWYWNMNKNLFWPNKRDPNQADGEIEEDDEEKAQHQQQQNQIFDSIIKIYATHKEPDYIMPWQSKHPESSTSSGFVIKGNRIMTNAHSVEYATMIQVQKRGDPTKYRAIVEVIANECDLAILNVLEQDIDECNVNSVDVVMNGTDDESNGLVEMENDEKIGNQGPPKKRHNMEFWDGLEEHPLEFGPLPELQEEVEVVGYPQGGNGLSITSGVVSRVELQGRVLDSVLHSPVQY